jgi:hypothetical protein
VPKCKKLAKLTNLSYTIPTVNIEELDKLEARLLAESKDWGIWNDGTGDWVRDKAGKVDSRAFKRNIKTLINIVIAESIISNAKNSQSE